MQLKSNEDHNYWGTADLPLDLFIFIACECAPLYSLLSETTGKKVLFFDRTTGLYSLPYLWIMICFNSRVKGASVYRYLHGGDSGGINCCIC